MWMIAKWILGLIPGLAGMFNAKEATKQAHEYGKASVGVAAAGALADEAIARQGAAQSYAAAGMHWAVFMILFPAFLTATAAAVHFSATVLVSIFRLGEKWGWVILGLPAPMNEWQGVILTTIGGGGGLLIGGMLYGRR